jgi:hypothetical protein
MPQGFSPAGVASLRDRGRNRNFRGFRDGGSRLAKINLENMAEALKSEESWAAAMKKADIPPDSDGTD